jgi:hypothetical protein
MNKIIKIVIFFVFFNLHAQKESDLEYFNELLKDSLNLPPNELKELKVMINKFFPKPSEKLNLELDSFFLNVAKVEVYAYLDRNLWNRNDYDNYRIFTNFIDGKVNIKEKYIKNKIILNNYQIDKMKNIMKRGSIINPASCYNPRHLIVYYDVSNRILGYIELCFSCYTTNSSSNLNLIETSVFNLESFFKDIGITYFDEINE